MSFPTLRLPTAPNSLLGRTVTALLLANWLAVGMLWYNAGASFVNEADPEPTLDVRAFLPLLATPSLGGDSACATASTAQFSRVPVVGPPADHPDWLHGDLNLALRGYEPVSAALTLVHINGPTDPDAPQLPGIFADNRVPAFSAAFQVYQWDWNHGAHGRRGDLLHDQEMTLLGMVTQPGELIHVPARAPQIYPEALVALVLYAEPTRITLTYLREDTVAHGYAVHLENLCVDPALLALYRELNLAGRQQLPALHNGEPLGRALDQEIRVAVRDRGRFMDPRSRKDWWKNR